MSFLKEKNLIIIMFFFLMGSTAVFTGSPHIEHDVLVTIFIATILGIPLMLLYGKLIRIFKNHNLTEMLYLTFGNFVGKMFTILYVIYAFFITAISMNNFATFIKYNDLPDTPTLFISLLIIIVCIRLLKSGLHVVNKYCMFLFPFILCFILVPLLLSGEMFEIKHIFPLVTTSIPELLKNSIYLVTLLIGELVLILSLGSSIKENCRIYKTLITGLLISLTFIFIIYLRNLLILGPYSIDILTYPSYYAASLVKIRDSFQRFEILVTTSFIFNDLIKIVICIYFMLQGITKIFNISNQKLLIIPVSMLSLAFGLIAFPNYFIYTAFITIFPIIALPFQVIIPLIMLITISLKKKFEQFKIPMNISKIFKE